MLPAAASSRLGWLGVAREPSPGTATMPVAAVPAMLDAWEPADTPHWLLDQGVRASHGSVAGVVQGQLDAVFGFGAPLYPDSGGYWLDNLLGDLSTVSAGTFGTARPLSAPLAIGATSLTVSTSLGAVTTGSVIQITDGAASEVVSATSGSTGTAVNFTGTPCRFAHTTAATAALQTAASDYSHTFAVLNTGQPPTSTLTDTTGLTATVGARAYPYASVTQIDLAGDPASGFIMAKVSGVCWPSQPSASAPVFPGVFTTAFPGWRASVLVGGSAPYAGPWSVSLKRDTIVYWGALSTQAAVIARGPLAVTGSLAYPDPRDETPLAQMLSSGYTSISVTAANGLSAPNTLSMSVSVPVAQFVTSRASRNAPAVSYGNTWQGVDSVAGAGGSGGIGPVLVSLTNAQATY